MKSFVRRDAKLVYNSNPKLAMELIAQSLERIGSKRAEVRKQVMNALHLSKQQVDEYSTEMLESLLRNNERATEKLDKANRRFLAANARGKKVVNEADAFWAKLKKIAASDSAAAESARDLLEDYGEGAWESDDEQNEFIADYKKFVGLNRKTLKNEFAKKEEEEDAMNKRARNLKAKNSYGHRRVGHVSVSNAADDDATPLRAPSTLPEPVKNTTN